MSRIQRLNWRQHPDVSVLHLQLCLAWSPYFRSIDFTCLLIIISGNPRVQYNLPAHGLLLNDGGYSFCSSINWLNKEVSSAQQVALPRVELSSWCLLLWVVKTLSPFFIHIQKPNRLFTLVGTFINPTQPGILSHPLTSVYSRRIKDPACFGGYGI